jgi:1-phosphatidylinositol phosphodiesterase
MSRIGDGRSLGELSIPGSHNSAARFEPLRGTAKCQSLTISEQLDAGVRVLDIRCRHLRDDFRIHHGQVDQKIGFKAVMAACIGFIDRNPGETVLILVQEEFSPGGNTRSFESTFDAVIAGERERWWLRPEIPALGGVRGKLVLVRRFAVKQAPKGIDGTAWTDFKEAGGDVPLRVQDRFRVEDNDAKWRACLEAFRVHTDGASAGLFLNYASGYRPGALGLPDIRAVSDDLNERLADHLRRHANGSHGIVMMDFVDPERAALVYRANFPKKL